MAEIKNSLGLLFGVQALKRSLRSDAPDDIGTYSVRLNDFEIKALVAHFETAAGRAALSEERAGE